MITNQELNSTTIYANLTELAGTKQRSETLNRLKEACDSLTKDGVVFSLKDIEIYCKRNFGKGPAAQTISNDKYLLSYVNSRQNEMTLRRRKIPSKDISQEIENIDDLELKSRMRAFHAECQHNKKKLRLITTALLKLNPPMDMELVLTGKRANANIQQFPNSQVDREQRDAFTHILRIFSDESTVKRIGLDMDEGDIVSRGRRETIGNLEKPPQFWHDVDEPILT